MLKFIKNVFSYWVLCLCGIIAASAIYMLKANEIYYQNAGKSDKAVQEIALGTQPVSGNSLLSMIDIRALQSQIPGIVGWIYQEDTQINYPIMYKAGDNDYYLKHDAMGGKSSFGSIFMDGRNNPAFSDKNTIIYGHNMKNGAMFGSLKKYVTDKSYYTEHPTFWIVTAEGYKEYNIIGAYTESYKGNSFTVNFDSDTDYTSFLTQCKAKSLYDTGINYDTSKNIMTLVSCYSSGTKGIKTVVVIQEK